MSKRPENFSAAEALALAARICEVIDDAGGVNTFARLSGSKSTGTLSQYKNGITVPSVPALIRIAAASGVTLDWLATGREPKYRRDIRAAPSVTASGKKSIAAIGSITIFHPPQEKA
jgi:transcriptional regulator with XRE-family HTH domain